MKNLITLLLMLWLIPAHALDIHVATNGADSNKGTKSNPLLTIEAAQKKLRASGRIGKESCKIIIHQGTYRLNAPLSITTADGGSEKYPIIYCAADKEEVVITGAQLISSNWELYKDGIYRTNVGDLNAIDQLFVDSKRQHMARYPNFNAGFIPIDADGSVRGKKAGTPPFNGCTPDAWDATKAAEWKNPKGAILNGMHRGLWGSQHYFVSGKDKNGELIYKGGWQNNRSAPPHKGYRMIENVFEELDAPGEWFHNTEEGWLYYMPATGVHPNEVTIEAVLQMKHLIEIYGDYQQPVAEIAILKSGNGLKETLVKNYITTKPVKNIEIRGLHFTGTKRTLIETIEPLLRSDWCVYRGGAIHIRGAENIHVSNCSFEELGGNAVFIDSYNRNIKIKGNLFQNNGSTDVNLVGSFAAVRNPSYNFRDLAVPLNEVDTIVGPKSDDYPADCLVEDNLMMRCGRFEKQASGINVSMSSRITLRHNTISHTPRAAINICDGTWGGHIIEWNDCFETVLETHDHGAFNSWGRDRYWHRCSPSGPNKKDENGIPLISHYIERYPNAPFWDAYQTSIIRNNRMQCDHGWDIDLDDGSTNYEIYNNVCLSGGLKTREGYRRIVTNNVILGSGYTCNVPYPKPTQDIFVRNILWGPTAYRSSNPKLWGGIRNFNFIHNPDAKKVVPAYGVREQTEDDLESRYGNVLFAAAPELGDFTVASKSPALNLGYKNFPMTDFGVTSDELKNLAKKPSIQAPEAVASNIFVKNKISSLLGGQFKTLETEAEISATGMFDKYGVLLVSVPKDSELAKMGFKVDDVVIELNSNKIAAEQIFINSMNDLSNGEHTVKVWRHQEAKNFSFLSGKTSSVSAQQALNTGSSIADTWTIETQEDWQANMGEQSNLDVTKGKVIPTAKEAIFKSSMKKFTKKRSVKSITLSQTTDWLNWEPVSNIGPSNLGDAPIALQLGDGNYWMFGRYNKNKKGRTFQDTVATLEGFDMDLKTTRFKNQFNAPGGLKPAKGGYHAWQSRDMKNWVHHGPISDKEARWMTTAEYVNGTFYFYYDFPNDQDPHLIMDKDLRDGQIGKKMGMAFNDPTHGSDCAIIRDLEGKFHIIGEDWSPIDASTHGWDSPLAIHAISPDGINDFKILNPPVDERTKPTGTFAEYSHPHWHKEAPDRFPGKTVTIDVPKHRMKAGDIRAFGKYEIHEPEQNAYGDWASISIGGQYYLFGDFDPAGSHGSKGMSVAWFTSDDINKPFTFCGNVGKGHPDPDIVFAEGQFYLITQQKTDFISSGPWVETVEVRMGVDTTNDGLVNNWSDWQIVKEQYDYIKGFSKQIGKIPAQLNFLDLPKGYGFQFELKMTDTTENESKPILDKVVVLFEE